MNKEEALQATKTGAIVACISGTLTLAVSLFAIWNNSSGRLELWNDPVIFLDILLIFFLAYGIYKKSLTAAVVMFIYFIFARIFVVIETGQVTGIVLGLVFLYFFGKAAQGAFVLQKIGKAESPDNKVKPKWITFLKIKPNNVTPNTTTMGSIQYSLNNVLLNNSLKGISISIKFY